MHPANIVSISGDSNSGKTSRMLALSAHYLNDKKKILYATSDSTPLTVVNKLRELGCKVNFMIGNLAVLNANSFEEVDPELLVGFDALFFDFNSNGSPYGMTRKDYQESKKALSLVAHLTPAYRTVSVRRFSNDSDR